MPSWFKTLCRGIAPSNVVGQYANSLDQPVDLGGKPLNNRNMIFTHWKGLSLNEPNLAIADIVNNIAPTGNTNHQLDANRQYVTNVVRKHRWRNTLGGGEMEIQFYQLTPRDHIPSAYGAGNALTVAPLTTNDYTVGGALQNPSMYSQPFLDQAADVTGQPQIPFDNSAATPFMSPLLTSFFKIKPLTVQGPNGKGSLVKLQPGEECSFTGRYRGPHMVSANKYLMSGISGGGATMAGIWAVRKGMPLIFCMARGSLAHDSTTKSRVGLGPTGLDYFQDYSFELWAPTPEMKQTLWPTTNIPLINGGTAAAGVMDQVDIVNATDTVIVEN